MDTKFILDIVLITFSVIVGTLLSLVLYRAFIILGRVEKTMEFIDHVREMLEMWERIPFELLKKLTSFLSK
ncbi:hypothetical protein GW819_00430 [Candidatus Gracilibacteria bacterium]|nr:hypothetical protein [bacterium]NDK19290.1 hypothetical protein [Candidatus Gracilibacteria bacterium]OIO76471.1 MAG: hypothetical protein AUJ87_02890 [Candidatus Gracilibacteria bacterium CG1_02_38_174]PIQ10795.1 MAG: hypothetical protein COW68_03915 [Candidatus Gracilibacteria bacterium CG18_big_fil_WC_8_21_14_2_50_38_16]PIQ42067.1 MAG: hypothetical protein COW06_00990 [Candidatus Gracilibacteria bacterium CG12_big_fil_rev_8_21_14_0_65_38_15]PIZ01877.1 MAG: hypothetical protein COY60_0113